MSAPLQLALFPDLLPSVVASRARMSQGQAKGQGSRESDPVSGLSCGTSSSTTPPRSSSLKTSHRAQKGGCARCGPICTLLVTEHVPSRYLPRMSGHLSSEGESSSLPSTPPNSKASAWPTPTAGDSKASGAAGYSTENGRHAGTTLTDAVVRFPKAGLARPTPSATVYGSNQGGAAGRVGPPRPSLETLGRTEKGKLNPAWVETLMGFPEGWTVIDGQPEEVKNKKPGSPRGRSRASKSTEAHGLKLSETPSSPSVDS
jgi:hypothetical protein